MLHLGDNIQILDKDQTMEVRIKADGSVTNKEFAGSIHKMAQKLQGVGSCNGWDYWYVKVENEMMSIDELRDRYRREFLGIDKPKLIS